MEELGGAVAEPEIIDTGIEEVEAPEVESSPEVETSEEPTEEQAVDLPVEQETADGRTIPIALRNAIASLKESNPAAAKQLKDLFFADRALRTEFPRGLPEIREIKTAWEAVGGQEGIREIQADLSVHKEIDQQYEAGDGRFIESIVKHNPEAFKKMMAPALAKYAQVDPAGYNHQLGQVFAATLDSVQLSDDIRGMGNAIWMMEKALSLGDGATIGQILGQIKSWAQGMQQTARQAPVAKQADPREQELQRREQEFSQRESTARDERLNTKINSFNSNMVRTEAGKHAGNKKLSEDQIRAIYDTAVPKVHELLKNDADFQAKAKRLQGDEAGLEKLITSRQGQLLPTQVANAYKLLFAGFSQPLKAKPTAPPAPANGTKPAAGFQRIAARPGPWEIDRSPNGTTNDMLFQNQAVLKDGRRVTWGS